MAKRKRTGQPVVNETSTATDPLRPIVGGDIATDITNPATIKHRKSARSGTRDLVGNRRAADPTRAAPIEQRKSARSGTKSAPVTNLGTTKSKGATKSAPANRSKVAKVHKVAKVEDEGSESALSDVPPEAAAEDEGVVTTKANKKRKIPKKTLEASKKQKASKVDAQAGVAQDPEEGGDEEEPSEAIAAALARPAPVNSDYLPLPWKGRLGFACLNTYLRSANPSVFSSRTCRISSILDHRHPLKDPSQPEHPTKNRPDKEQPPDVARGQRWVESLGLANARDIIKMVRWNDRYGIKFMRLSSEMFPFASHDEYGYKLAPFAAETLAEVGKVIAELGHRVTTHPGQFTQLGSPRSSVVTAAIRDLDYHDEMLSLLKLPPQPDRDAVMILHMGGVFGDKGATLDRFRENYAKLPDSVKARLVLENDDVSWHVHDLLPVCKELNIPMVLDYHHHNIMFDAEKIREGTLDIMDLYDEIAETWRRKNITQKMHYSEPTDGAITGRQRRKHRPRVENLPPCAPDMDLMLEAKDKEQAVFELMKKYKLPGHEKINEMLPHVRVDENKVEKRKKKAKDDEEDEAPPVIPDDEISMGGPEGRVYWPLGKEEWLRPPKRVVKKAEKPGETQATPASSKKSGTAAKAKPKSETVVTAKPKSTVKERPANAAATPKATGKVKTAKKKTMPTKKAQPVLTPSASESEAPSLLSDVENASDVSFAQATPPHKKSLPRRASGRAAKVSYLEVEMSE